MTPSPVASSAVSQSRHDVFPFGSMALSSMMNGPESKYLKPQASDIVAVFGGKKAALKAGKSKRRRGDGPVRRVQKKTSGKDKAGGGDSDSDDDAATTESDHESEEGEYNPLRNKVRRLLLGASAVSVSNTRTFPVSRASLRLLVSPSGAYLLDLEVECVHVGGGSLALG